MRTSYPALLLGLLALLSACGGMEQEVWVNADGSGRTRVAFDASEMLPMLDAPLGANADAEVPEGSPQLAFVEVLGRDRVDTTFLLADLMGEEAMAMMMDPAAVAEETGREVTDGMRDTMALAYEVMTRTRVSIDLDRPAGRLGMAMLTGFDDVRGATFSGVLDKSIAEQLQQTSPGATTLNASELLLRLDGNRLDVRIPTSAVAEAMAQQLGQQTGEADVDPEQALAMVSMMGMDSYPLLLHVPGKITEVTAPGGHELAADNAVRLKIDYLELARARTDYEASVHFKPKRKYRVVTD